MSHISKEELTRHATPQSCWVAIHGIAYDLTEFALTHPGGAAVVHKAAGTDATAEFDMIHSRQVLHSLPPNTMKGTCDPPLAAASSGWSPVKDVKLEDVTSLKQFQQVAERNMTEKAWVYYASAAGDEASLRENEAAFRRLMFRPRVLVEVSSPVTTATTILGHPVASPVFISPSAVVGMAHPDGEVGLCRAAFAEGIVQVVPCFSSQSLADIAASRGPGQIQFFQLYMNTDRALSEKAVQQAEALGFKALLFTVDAPILGRRLKDMKHAILTAQPGKPGVGEALRANSFLATDLTWRDVRWLRSITSMKIIVKGIQRGDDALLAIAAGAHGLLLSNHGGRQLDTARSGVEVLIEVAATLRAEGLLDSTELLVDGGVRTGADVAKCIALGARAVGFARPVVSGLAAFGQAGAERALRIVTEELRECMAYLGASAPRDITAAMLVQRAGAAGVTIRSGL